MKTVEENKDFFDPETARQIKLAFQTDPSKIMIAVVQRLEEVEAQLQLVRKAIIDLQKQQTATNTEIDKMGPLYRTYGRAD